MKRTKRLKQDVLDLIEAAAQNPGYIVASSEPIPGSNQSGDNPPHARAKARYQEIAPTDFLCTQEHPDHEQPHPIVFQATRNGFVYAEAECNDKAKGCDNSNGSGVRCSRFIGPSLIPCGLRRQIMSPGPSSALDQLRAIEAAPGSPLELLDFEEVEAGED